MPNRPLHPKDRRLCYRGRTLLLPELEMVGWDDPRHAGDLGLRPHRHADAFEICLIVGGAVEWWVRRGRRTERFTVEPGRLFITRPGEEHGGVDAVLHPCELYWLQLHPVGGGLPGMTAAQSRRLLRDLARAPRVLPVGEAVRYAFERIIAEHHDRRPAAEVAARSGLHALLVEIVRAPTAGGDGATGPSPLVRRAMRWMTEHLADDFSVDDVAAEVGLSVTQFHDRFHREVGQPPGDWRTRRRVTRAKELLRDRSKTILDVALEAGFASSQYFATVFRRIVGLTPRDYRTRLVSREGTRGRDA